MMKKINIDGWIGEKHYEWFKKYDQPTYTLTSTLDVTHLIQTLNQTHLSFFIPFLYLVTKALNTIPEFRYRMMGDDVVEYDIIHPAYTVMTNDGVFDNCENEYHPDFPTFYRQATMAIAMAKQGLKQHTEYNDMSRLNQYYFSCLPWIDFVGVTHPIPKDATISVPRIVWGKYYEENGHYKIHINFCVHHALIDGYPLSQALIKIQAMMDEAEQHIKSL